MKPEDIEHFTFSDFPEECVFALSWEHQSISLLQGGGGSGGEGGNSRRPRLLGQVLLTERELDVFLAMRAHHPSFVPYEVVLAAFLRGYEASRRAEVTRIVAESLQEAHLAGQWDAEIRPLRNCVSRVRFKVRVLGLEVISLLDTGYMLMRSPKWRPPPSSG
jgi:hypothetical protein